MEIITYLLHSLNSFDLVVGGFSFLVGFAGAAKKFRNNPFVGVTVFFQVSLLVVKMAKHYYDTHPDARKRMNPKHLKLINQLYVNNLKGKENPRLLHDSQTGAIG